MKQLLFLITFFFSLVTYSQKNNTLLYGNVKDSLGYMANVHVYNISNKQGTFTTSNGEFKIFAKEKDTLRISFIGYTTKK